MAAVGDLASNVNMVTHSKGFEGNLGNGRLLRENDLVPICSTTTPLESEMHESSDTLHEIVVTGGLLDRNQADHIAADTGDTVVSAGTIASGEGFERFRTLRLI